MHDHYIKNVLEYGQYIAKEDAKTYAFELPNYNLVETELIKSITNNNYIPVISFKVGIAKLHPNDNYVKETGRKIAEANMVMRDFAVYHIISYPEDNEIIIFVRDGDVNLRIAIKKEYRNIRILSVL